MTSPRRIARDVPWRLVFAVWSVPALADAVDSVITDRMSGRPMSLLRAFGLVAPGWYLWALLTPLIFWLGRTLPVRRPLRIRVVAAQLALSVVAGLCHAFVLALRVAFLQPDRPVLPMRGEFLMALSDWLPISIVIYWAILGAGAALDNFRRYREQELRASELATRLARSELAVLRAQLHPHFLFNALNTGVSLVRANEPARGVRVLTHLGDLLRYMLRDDAAQEHTLREELTFLRNYLEIELARFGERLAVHVDVRDELLDAVVPSLTLQPLVENAIRHGIAPRDAPGRIEVSASASGGMLTLRVVDDGRGLSASQEGAASGVGLSNTRARLARLYGERGTLRIANRPGGGVEATVRLPLTHASPTTVRVDAAAVSAPAPTAGASEVVPTSPTSDVQSA
ncbi:MAG TPA: sensor histidine kinase [Gemmatimonadaceae bacterium]|nr:sensor histidine kinase [Gemmatimonadaceae bacterium]